MSEQTPRHRNVVFTINADERHHLRLLDFQHESWSKVKYCVYQREMGEHEHFQGYMELASAMTYSALHAMDGLERAHFQRRFGSAKQAQHYCFKPVDGCICRHCAEEREHPTKLEGPWEFGEISRQGQRAELVDMKHMIDNGRRVRELMADDEHFPVWVKHHKAFETYERRITTARNFKPTVMLLVGPSGTGKSRTAHTLAAYLGEGKFYKVPNKHTGFWCDDYDYSDVFLFEEMNGNKMTPEFFNELVDRYGFIVPAHGHPGHQFISRYIIITSNYHPKFWWKKRSADQVKQTMRRIDIVMKFLHPKVHVHTIGCHLGGLCICGHE